MIQSHGLFMKMQLMNLSSLIACLMLSGCSWMMEPISEVERVKVRGNIYQTLIVDIQGWKFVPHPSELIKVKDPLLKRAFSENGAILVQQRTRANALARKFRPYIVQKNSEVEDISVTGKLMLGGLEGSVSGVGHVVLEVFYCK